MARGIDRPRMSPRLALLEVLLLPPLGVTEEETIVKPSGMPEVRADMKELAAVWEFVLLPPLSLAVNTTDPAAMDWMLKRSKQV